MYWIMPLVALFLIYFLDIALRLEIWHRGVKYYGYVLIPEFVILTLVLLALYYYFIFTRNIFNWKKNRIGNVVDQVGLGIVFFLLMYLLFDYIFLKLGWLGFHCASGFCNWDIARIMPNI